MNAPNTEQTLKTRREKFGFAYGAAGGLFFAFALWGFDGLLLAQSHAMLPWLKLIVGGVPAILICGAAGWLAERWESPLLAVLLWLAASALLGLLVVLVPLTFAPWFTGMFVPATRPWLQYAAYANLPVLVGVAFGWVAVSAFIVAVIQIPMIEQAIFSLSGFGRIRPHLVCAFLLLISGRVADSLNNQPLRDPIRSLDETIQFALETRGQQVDGTLARQKRLASLRPVQDLLQPERRLVVSRYDARLESIYVLVDFDGQWIECATFYGSPAICKSLSP